MDIHALTRYGSSIQGRVTIPEALEDVEGVEKVYPHPLRSHSF